MATIPVGADQPIAAPRAARRRSAQLLLHERRKRIQQEPRHEHADQRRRAPQQQPLCKKHPGYRSASRAQRRPDRDLSLTADRADQQEACDVGARHQQHEADSREQQQERPLHPPGDLLSQRRGGQSDREARALQFGGIGGVDPSCQDVELRPCFA